MPWDKRAEVPTAPIDSSAATAAEAPVAVSALDPINAPPPPAGATPTSAAMLVPAPNASAPTDESQRVPLGTLGTAAPASGPPMAITQAPPTQAPPTQAAPQATAQAPAAQQTAQAAAPTPEVRTNPESTVIQPRPMPAPAPAVVAAAPVRPAAPAPRLQSPRGTPASSPASSDDKKPQGEDETIVISSASQPVFDAREFMPASVEAGKLPVIQRSLGDIPMTAAEKNVVQRFETLRRLAEDSLITQEEFVRRRQANVGALLPYTKDPAAEGLERSVPSSDAIVARLAALRRSFEMRAITAPQHAMERTMILNALLPETPQDRMDRKPPPVDVIQGAAMVGHLEQIRQKNLITTAEFEAEKAAIEHVLRTGLLPSQEMQDADEKKAAAAKAASAKAKPSAASAASAAAPADITGPVVHLGSFRNEDSAKQGWQEIVAQNKTTLGSLKQVIRRVELGQGTFYRVMAGPFNSVSDAEAVCIQLKQANQFCRASADGS